MLCTRTNCLYKPTIIVNHSLIKFNAPTYIMLNKLNDDVVKHSLDVVGFKAKSVSHFQNQIVISFQPKFCKQQQWFRALAHIIFRAFEHDKK